MSLAEEYEDNTPFDKNPAGLARALLSGQSMVAIVDTPELLERLLGNAQQTGLIHTAMIKDVQWGSRTNADIKLFDFRVSGTVEMFVAWYQALEDGGKLRNPYPFQRDKASLPVAIFVNPHLIAAGKEYDRELDMLVGRIGLIPAFIPACLIVCPPAGNYHHDPEINSSLLKMYFDKTSGWPIKLNE